MLEAFDSPRLLIERARELIAEIAAYPLNDESRQRQTEARGERKNANVVVFYYRVPPIPQRLTTITRDALSNLRSALDHAASASAKTILGRETKKTKFPFGDTVLELENNIKTGCADMHDEIKDLIRQIKPFEKGNNLLWSLNKDRNFKEHSMLIPVGMAPQLGNIYTKADSVGSVEGPFWDFDKEVVYFVATGIVDVTSYFRMALHFGRAGHLSGKPLVSTLNAIANEIDEIVGAIEVKTQQLLSV